MNCDHVKGSLADYLGDELDDTARQAIDNHLAACANCRAEVESLAHSRRVLEGLDTVSLASADARTRHLHVVPIRPPWQRIGLSLLKTAAILAMGILLGRWTIESSLPHQSPPIAGETATPARPPAVHPEWIKLASRMEAAGSPLSDQLISLARSSAAQ